VASLALRTLAVALGGSLAAAGVGAGLALALGSDPSRIGLAAQMIVVGVVWLLTSAGLPLALRITELPAIIALMVDLLRRPRGA